MSASSIGPLDSSSLAYISQPLPSEKVVELSNPLIADLPEEIRTDVEQSTALVKTLLTQAEELETAKNEKFKTPLSQGAKGAFGLSAASGIAPVVCLAIAGLPIIGLTAAGASIGALKGAILSANGVGMAVGAFLGGMCGFILGVILTVKQYGVIPKFAIPLVGLFATPAGWALVAISLAALAIGFALSVHAHNKGAAIRAEREAAKEERVAAKLKEVQETEKALFEKVKKLENVIPEIKDPKIKASLMAALRVSQKKGTDKLRSEPSHELGGQYNLNYDEEIRRMKRLLNIQDLDQSDRELINEGINVLSQRKKLADAAQSRLKSAIPKKDIKIREGTDLASTLDRINAFKDQRELGEAFEEFIAFFRTSNPEEESTPYDPFARGKRSKKPAAPTEVTPTAPKVTPIDISTTHSGIFDDDLLYDNDSTSTRTQPPPEDGPIG